MQAVADHLDAMTTGRDWDRIFRAGVPGYDPWRDAGDRYVFDESKAIRACEFFPDCLVHSKGAAANTPFDLLEWEAAIVGNAFGWIDKETGLRRYRVVFVYVPRKNGKTSLAAGMALFVFYVENEPGAEVYCAAADREQASIVFDISRAMVEHCPAMLEISKIYTKAIVIHRRYATFRVLSSDAKTKHGFNANCVVVDELHAQPNSDLVDVLVTSTGARLQPLTIFLTTADYDRPSLCNDEYEYATRVRDGVIEDPAYLPVIWEAPREAPFDDEDVWRAANPTLGAPGALTFDYLRSKCLKAQESASFENTFRRLHLNQKTQTSVRWLRLDKWDASAGPHSLDEIVEATRGRPVFGGLDLASTSDLTALVAAFKMDGGAYALRFWFWSPRETAEMRERRDRVPYIGWSRAGLVTLTDGDETDYEAVRADVNRIGEEIGLEKIAADRLFQGAQLCQNLAADGFDVVAFGQGFFSMAAPAKEFERLVNRGLLWHAGNPVARFMAGNVTVAQDPAGNIKPDRKRSTERIDGIVAGVMAVGLATTEKPKKRSVYEDRGLIAISKHVDEPGAAKNAN